MQAVSDVQTVNTRALRGPSIGAAIIVKNAESSIGRTIESLEGFADQVVVVDTGSTDSTPFVAARHGAELHYKKWQNDFSAARNHALRMLRTDWVLVIDADEQLLTERTPELVDQLIDQLNDTSIGGLQVCIHNALSANDATSIDHHYTRLFRRLPSIKFEGSIHEQVADSIRVAGLRIERSAVEINHDGYREVSQQKTERNASMLRNELEKNPNDVWTQYHLGLTEFGAGHLSEAAALLEPIRTSAHLTNEQQEIATIRCAQCALAADDFLRVEELLQHPCEDSEREGLRQYVLGAAYCNKLNFAAGLRCFVQARDTKSRLIDQDLLQNTINQINSLKRH